MKLFSIAQMMFQAVTAPRAHLAVPQIPEGRVIDIGGGGEGVIARAGGAAVVAVDKLVSEIYEAKGQAPTAVWLAADATALPYASHSFDNATAFFSCMYMPDDVKEKVFGETQRVLKKGGEFWIWDAHMIAKSRPFVIRVQVDLPDGRRIKTGYGVRAKNQSPESVGHQLRQAGFEWEITANQKSWFSMRARKV